MSKEDMTIWLIILGMAIATYATRVTTLLALRGDVAPWLRSWLGYVPLLLSEQAGVKVLSIGPALPAGIIGGLVAWRSSNVLLTITVGLATFWALKWLGM